MTRRRPRQVQPAAHRYKDKRGQVLNYNIFFLVPGRDVTIQDLTLLGRHSAAGSAADAAMRNLGLFAPRRAGY